MPSWRGARSSNAKADMRDPNRQQLRLSGGTELSFITAGEASRPAVLLLHGTPQSARYFRDILPELSRVAYVIAPDLPGFGESDLLPTASFPAYGQAISELLDRLAIGPRYIYVRGTGWSGPLQNRPGRLRGTLSARPA